MQLDNASVFLDFDGTITTVDTGVHLLDRLAAPEWREVEALYKTGRIGSRECMTRQWEMLPHDRAAIEDAVRQVPLDDGFPALVDHLRTAGAEVAILSDGYGFRAEEVGRQADVTVLTNGVDWDRFTVVFPDTDPSCPCGLCGTCKRAPIEEARRRGRVTILVGDGASDSRAAEVADTVFAKDELAQFCRDAGLPFRPFATLGDVLAAMSGPSS